MITTKKRLYGSILPRGVDGRGIVSIAKTATAGLVDTYTITYTDGSTSTFTITNGANGEITAVSFAAPFSASTAYAAGDYVVYSGQLYQFTTAHAAGAWTGSDATAIQLANEVHDLKSAINAVENISEKQPSLVWEQGTLSSGAEADSNIRIRSDFYPFPKNAIVTATISAGYNVEFDFYDSSKAYKSDKGWLDGTANFASNADGFIRILIRKSNNANITPADNVNVTFSITPAINRVIDIALNTPDGTKINDSSVWNYGSRTGSGDISARNWTIYSDYFHVNKDDVISMAFDEEASRVSCFIEIVLFDNLMNLITVTGYQENAYRFTTDGVASFNVRKRDSSEITAEEKAALIAGLTYHKHAINKRRISEEIVKAINHQGWWESAQNTLPAFVQSFVHDFKYVETDIRFTLDDVGVLLHDAEIAQGVDISSITYSEALNYKSDLATLTDFLKLCRELSLSPYLDMKAGSRAQIESIVDSCVAFGIENNVTFLVNYYNQGIYVTEKMPTARVGVITSPNAISARYLQTFMTGKNEVVLDITYSNLTNDAVNYAKQYDLPIEVWTVDDTAAIDSLNPYATGITSNKINVNTYYQSKYTT